MIGFHLISDEISSDRVMNESNTSRNSPDANLPQGQIQNTSQSKPCLESSAL